MNKKSALLFSSALGVLLLAEMLFPAHPAMALPPRPNPPSVSPPVVGGGIELRAWAAQTIDWENVHTLVQWQDGLGGWHDVDGWRGTLDEIYADGGRKTWFVPEAHFGTGPFRWVVYVGEETLVTGDPFDMPATDNQLVRTIITLP
jgi:hypothetical protein